MTENCSIIEAHLAARLRTCHNLVVFTGAGMSAESGIPTFRDRFEGLWAKYDPQDVATPEAFRANPQFVWDWHVYLADAVRRARPNAGHVAVARMERHVPRLSVITQNIDNLHQTAGSKRVLELHGNLFRLKAFVDAEELFAGDRSPVICPVCDGYAVWEHCDPYASKEDLEAIELRSGPVPHCPGCGAVLRPDIVWFGEPLDHGILAQSWLNAETCDALICIGTSLEVEPAASIPWRAHLSGALIIEVNPVPTKLSKVTDVSLIGGAAKVLPELLEQVWGECLGKPGLDKLTRNAGMTGQYPFVQAPVPEPLTREVLDELVRQETDRLRGSLTPEEFSKLVSSMPIPSC